MISYLKRLFLPLKTNNYRPRILEWDYFLLLVLFIVGVKVLSIVSLEMFLGADIYNSISQTDLYTLTNETRGRNNLTILSRNPKLEFAAQMKLDDMFQNNYFAHISPAGVTPWAWIGKADYQYTVAGENLAMNFFSSQDTMRAWLDSDAHRRNILLPEFTEVGIAVRSGLINNQDTIAVVQMFGKPKITVAVVQPKQNPVNIVRPTPARTPISSEVKSQIDLQDKSGIRAYSINLFLERVMVLLFAITVGLILIKVFVNINVQVPELVLRGVILVLLSGVLANIQDIKILAMLHSNVILP